MFSLWGGDERWRVDHPTPTTDPQLIPLLLALASVTDTIVPDSSKHLAVAPWMATFRAQIQHNPALILELDDTVKVRKRPRAIELSDGYATRLKIHQIGSYVMLPLFASEFVVGQKLINDPNRPDGLRGAHRALALGIGGLFATNTVTGVMNWWETRRDPVGRARRTLHSLLMLAADAGFLWTASAIDDDGGSSNATHHRALAEASISVSALASVMMWVWKK